LEEAIVCLAAAEDDQLMQISRLVGGTVPIILYTTTHLVLSYNGDTHFHRQTYQAWKTSVGQEYAIQPNKINYLTKAIKE
jgi:hypothetical protein